MNKKDHFFVRNLLVINLMKQQHHDSQQFFLFGKAFHQINQLPTAAEKNLINWFPIFYYTFN
jgi:hypothetical protein